MQVDVKKVAKAIAYLRKRANYTQKDLAERLGVSDKAVSKWERGGGLPDVGLLGKLSVLLDTDTDSLLAGDVIHHDKGWNGVVILPENSYGIGASTVIYNKPLIYYMLCNFLLVGIKKIKIICNEKAEAFIRNELIDDAPLDIYISFARNIQTIFEDSDFLLAENIMVITEYSILYGVDQTKFLQRAMSNRDNITILALPRGNREEAANLRFDTNKRILSEDYEKQIKTQYEYCDTTFVFCPTKALQQNLQYALDAYDVSWMFKKQDVYIEALDRGFIEIKIRTWDDVLEASEFVRIVEKQCGMVLDCIEEVAWRRGLASGETVLRRAEKKQQTEYGKYIQSLFRNYSEVNEA